MIELDQPLPRGACLITDRVDQDRAERAEPRPYPHLPDRSGRRSVLCRQGVQ
jgi:hypothetical protein